jgi:Zn-dependent M28 family amino/carboxypeptidase
LDGPETLQDNYDDSIRRFPLHRRHDEEPTNLNSTSVYYTDVVSWTRDHLEALNDTPQVQHSNVNGSASHNLIADKPCSAVGTRDAVLSTAHVDSINIQGGSIAPTPGADDNARGSAGLLERARVFATHQSACDIRFMLFGGEEEGLYGNAQYFASLAESERSRIRAIVNMDMINNEYPDTQCDARRCA